MSLFTPPCWYNCDTYSLSPPLKQWLCNTGDIKRSPVVSNDAIRVSGLCLLPALYWIWGSFHSSVSLHSDLTLNTLSLVLLTNVFKIWIISAVNHFFLFLLAPAIILCHCTLLYNVYIMFFFWLIYSFAFIFSTLLSAAVTTEFPRCVDQ